MSAARVRRVCPVHDAAECERFGERLVADAESRHTLLAALEEGLWRYASARFAERDLAEKIPHFEVADGWRHGEAPAPSMERSVFLWQTFIAGEPVGGPGPKIGCPVVREFAGAQRRALVTAVGNHGGICLRDALFERPSLPFEATWPLRIRAHAKPDDRFLVRMPLFRGELLLDEIGISRIVLHDRLMRAVQDLAAQGHLEPRTPAWAWHLAAIWTTVATEEWARTALGATQGPATRQ